MEFNTNHSLEPGQYRIVMLHIKSLSQAYLMEDSNGGLLNTEEVHDKFSEYVPLIQELYHPSFIKGVFDGILSSPNLYFGFQRNESGTFFKGIKFRDSTDNAASPNKRPVREYPRRTAETSVIGMFEGHVKEEEGQKISVRDLEKLHNALDIFEDFGKVLDRLKSEGISLKEIPSKKTGKNRTYLCGLVMNDSGKKLLQQ